MSDEEKQVMAAIGELHSIAGRTVNPVASVALTTIMDELETMRPYVRAGLKVSATEETMHAINHLYYDGILTPEQWNTLRNILRLAREGSVPQLQKDSSGAQSRPANPPLVGALAS